VYSGWIIVRGRRGVGGMGVGRKRNWAIQTMKWCSKGSQRGCEDGRMSRRDSRSGHEHDD
jgi:hypothetical protein